MTESRERVETRRLADDGEHLVIVEKWLDRQVSPPRWRSKNRRVRLTPRERAYYADRLRHDCGTSSDGEAGMRHES